MWTTRSTPPFVFPDGATGQLAANWSDESFRKMSMQITIWGVNGRMRIDRQEIQIYLKEEQTSFAKFRRGWNTHYTTELTEPVWFYLRGEEYSMQIDHFVRCIKDRNHPQVSSFETALETDIVLSKMIQDASRVPAIGDTSDGTSRSQHKNRAQERYCHLIQRAASPLTILVSELSHGSNSVR